MVEGTYYKEWSASLDRPMEFKSYGRGGVPVLALPARGGRFYDWENNGMPDAVRDLLDEGKVQLFCADAIDDESFLAENASPRRRAERQEAYFNYLTGELADRILALNRPADKNPGAAPARLWAVGVDGGAYQAVNCRLRRPQRFAGAIGLSGVYDVADRLGGRTDDLALRNSPPDAVDADGILDKGALAGSGENSLLLCVGQGAGEGRPLKSTSALQTLMLAQKLPCHVELWSGEVSHDWYWWGRQLELFAGRLFD